MIEDREILEIAKQLCDNMGLKVAPKQLEWRYLLPGGFWARVMHVDECIVTQNSLLLPRKMRGQLEPRLWKPLIASSMVFTRKMSAKVLRHRVKWFLFGLLPVLLFDFLIYVFFLQKDISKFDVAFVMLSSILLLMALVLFSSIPLVRRLMLMADREAANLEEGEDLLSVLRKIESLDAEHSGRSAARSFGWSPSKPSLTARIENLEVLDARY